MIKCVKGGYGFNVPAWFIPGELSSTDAPIVMKRLDDLDLRTIHGRKISEVISHEGVASIRIGYKEGSVWHGCIHEGKIPLSVDFVLSKEFASWYGYDLVEDGKKEEPVIPGPKERYEILVYEDEVVCRVDGYPKAETHIRTDLSPIVLIYPDPIQEALARTRIHTEAVNRARSLGYEVKEKE